MNEQIGTISTVQANSMIQSVTENAKTKEVSEKEMIAVQADKPHKRDRFEYSSEASHTAAANASKAGEASNEELSIAKANDDSPRSYDRVEFTYAKASDSNDNSSSQSVSVDDSSDSVDTNKLYQYTDSELKEFLLDGSITQSEYDAEIAKREY